MESNIETAQIGAEATLHQRRRAYNIAASAGFIGPVTEQLREISAEDDVNIRPTYYALMRVLYRCDQIDDPALQPRVASMISLMGELALRNPRDTEHRITEDEIALMLELGARSKPTTRSSIVDVLTSKGLVTDNLRQEFNFLPSVSISVHQPDEVFDVGEPYEEVDLSLAEESDIKTFTKQLIKAKTPEELRETYGCRLIEVQQDEYSTAKEAALTVAFNRICDARVQNALTQYDAALSYYRSRRNGSDFDPEYDAALRLELDEKRLTHIYTLIFGHAFEEAFRLIEKGSFLTDPDSEIYKKLRTRLEASRLKVNRNIADNTEGVFSNITPEDIIGNN